MNPGRDAAAEKLIESFHSRSARCAIVGLGYIGSTLADAVLAAGFETHGIDRSPEVAGRCRNRLSSLHCSPARPWSAATDPSVIAQADVVLVAVRTPYAGPTGIDTEPLHSVARTIAEYPREPRLLVVETTLPPGITRRFARDLLKWTPDSTVFIAHSPERLSVGQDREVFARTPHIVGGLDPDSTRVAAAFYSQICDKVVPVPSAEVSELSKLLENAFLSVGIGLVNEITRIAHALGISATDVCAAAATKPSGYFPFMPGAGVGGHCLPNDLRMLAHTSRSLCFDGALLSAADTLNSRAPETVVQHLEDLMSRANRQLNGAKVLLVGVGFKIGAADTTATPARDVIRALRDRGAQVVYFDSQVPLLEVDGSPVERVGCGQLAPGCVCAAVILSGDPSLPAETLNSSASIILDTGGGRILPGGLHGASTL
jgi:nucleotide sugar dehydrogenase